MFNSSDQDGTTGQNIKPVKKIPASAIVFTGKSKTLAEIKENIKSVLIKEAKLDGSGINLNKTTGTIKIMDLNIMNQEINKDNIEELINSTNDPEKLKDLVKFAIKEGREDLIEKIVERFVDFSNLTKKLSEEELL